MRTLEDALSQLESMPLRVLGSVDPMEREDRASETLKILDEVIQGIHQLVSQRKIVPADVLRRARYQVREARLIPIDSETLQGILAANERLLGDAYLRIVSGAGTLHS